MIFSSGCGRKNVPLPVKLAENCVGRWYILYCSAVGVAAFRLLLHAACGDEAMVYSSPAERCLQASKKVLLVTSLSRL